MLSTWSVGTIGRRFLLRLMSGVAVMGACGAVVASQPYYGGFRPLDTQNYATQGQGAGRFTLQPKPGTNYPQTVPAWRTKRQADPPPMPYQGLAAPGSLHGYRFRDMPGIAAPQGVTPNYRPDSQTAGSAGNRNNNQWQPRYPGAPPVFRPLQEREINPGNVHRWRNGYVPGVTPSDRTSGEFHPGWMGFGPLPGE
jgi:hypothetical protein